MRMAASGLSAALVRLFTAMRPRCRLVTWFSWRYLLAQAAYAAALRAFSGGGLS